MPNALKQTKNVNHILVVLIKGTMAMGGTNHTYIDHIYASVKTMGTYRE